MTAHSDEPIDGGPGISIRDHFTLWIQRVEQSFSDRLETVERVNNERDLRYSERFAAAKALVDQANSASEKAILKAETAQKVYDAGHNGLLTKMDAQQQATMPRGETEAKIAAVEARCGELRKELEDLRKSRDQNEGSSVKKTEERGKNEFNLTTFISLAALALAIFLVLRK